MIGLYVVLILVLLIALLYIFRDKRLDGAANATKPFRALAPVLLGASLPPLNTPRSKIRSASGSSQRGGESSRRRRTLKKSLYSTRCNRNQNYRTGG